MKNKPFISMLMQLKNCTVLAMVNSMAIMRSVLKASLMMFLAIGS